MKKIIFAVLALVLTSSPSFALDPSIYEMLGIVPQFEQDLRIGSWDLLSFEYDEFDGQTILNVDLDSFYRLWIENETMALLVVDDANLWFSGDFASAADPAGGIGNFTLFNYTHFLPIIGGTPMSLFGELYTDSYIGFDEFGTSPNAFDEIAWSLGIGIGRLINVRPVSQVIAVVEKLGLTVSDSQIIDAAKIVSKSGEYYYLHRGVADEVYYGAIADILGVEDSMQVRRALRDTSALSEKRIGSELRVFYSQWHDGFDLMEPSINLYGSVGMPIGLNMYLSPVVYGTAYKEQVFETLMVDVTGGVLFAIDHSSDWSSFIQALVSANQDLDLLIRINMGSEVQILDRLYFNAAYSAQIEPGLGMLLNLDLGFQYYIF